VALILDKANTIRHKRQQTINLADQFLRSIFLEIFGDPITNPNNWEMKNLSELVDPARPITYGVLKAGPNYPSGVPLLKIQNIKGQKVINNNLHNITPELSQKYKRTILKGGEIIISLVGTIGRVAIIPNSLKGANIHRNFGLIAPNNLTNSCYLFHFLSLPHFKLILARSIKGGIQNLLNLNDLKRIKIPTPPKELIDSFETIVAKLDSFNGKTDNFKSHAENLYGSLCQRTFHGEL